MKLRLGLTGIGLLFLCLIAAVATWASTPQGRERDPLGGLKRGIAEAGAPALTSEQETQLKNLIDNLRQGRPQAPDEALRAAHEAYRNAIFAGDLAAAQAQAAIITSRTSELSNARLQADAKFKIDVLAVLRSGGQLDPLKQKLGDGRLFGLISSLSGGHRGGGRLGFGFGERPRR
jgi:Spy/CpxP family protein refolding chaperone